MCFASVYPLYVNRAECKRGISDELFQAIEWFHFYSSL
ncbi:MAG: DUF2200 domain-containing protein [Chitinophagaceae bacterium]|nr:DUF2200 domain-containing protein [Chitinophagaceae bacterium]